VKSRSRQVDEKRPRRELAFIASIVWEKDSCSLSRHSADDRDLYGPVRQVKAPLRELVVTGRRQMVARADCGRTLARSHGHFDALFVGTEVGMLKWACWYTNPGDDGSGLES
jgi:hypothetical protein